MGVRVDGAGTWDVFLRLNGVDLVFGFVALVWNGEKADAVNGRVGCTEPGNS